MVWWMCAAGDRTRDTMRPEDTWPVEEPPPGSSLLLTRPPDLVCRGVAICLRSRVIGYLLLIERFSIICTEVKQPPERNLQAWLLKEALVQGGRLNAQQHRARPGGGAAQLQPTALNQQGCGLDPEPCAGTVVWRQELP